MTGSLNGNTAAAYQVQPVEHDYYRLAAKQGNLNTATRMQSHRDFACRQRLTASEPLVKTLVLIT